MLNRDQARRIIQVVREAASGLQLDQLAASVITGGEGDLYYTICVAASRDPEAIKLVSNLLEELLGQLQRELGGQGAA